MTEGYSQYGLKFTPYGMTLKGFLDEQLENKDVVVNVQGVSGELVSKGMVERMKQFCE